MASEGAKPAKEDNFVFQTEGKNPFPTTDYSKMVYNKASGDTFDRSKKPGLGANPVVKVPEFWTSTFKNGMKVIGTKSDEIPTVSLQLTINFYFMHLSKIFPIIKNTDQPCGCLRI